VLVFQLVAWASTVRTNEALAVATELWMNKLTLRLTAAQNERAVCEQMVNVARNGPLYPGDTLSHKAARECVKRGWAKRDKDGNFVIDKKGD
jgi:hypothetical protein